jgi:hypothetical protein
LRLIVGKNVGRDLFYRLILPALAVLNLVLGLVLLSFLPPEGLIGWPVALTAAFCCLVAGWLGASAWSKSYWAIVMTRQVIVWRRMVDAIFEWLEDAPVPSDSIEQLKRSLEEARH